VADVAAFEKIVGSLDAKSDVLVQVATPEGGTLLVVVKAGS
jgi:hypothetical protein